MNFMQMMLRILVWANVLALGACGFHLKGNQAHDVLPVAKWQIDGALAQNLQQALQRAGGERVNHADAQLAVLAVDWHKQVYTLTHAGLVNEYALTLRVQVQAMRHGKAWGQAFTVESKRVMPYADSLILGKQTEEQTMRAEMQQEVSEKIIRRLGFLKNADS